jgi:AcrR family transcriptional regulator
MVAHRKRTQPSAKPRRTQEQRRNRTKERVLNAALDILAEQGYARLTTTAVAARAGVSRGAQENYYRTKADLIVAATAHAMDVATRQAAKSAAQAKNSPDPIAAFLADGRAFFLSRSYRAMVELALAGRNDPTLSRIHRDAFVKFRRDLDKVWIGTLCATGLPRAAVSQFVELTVFLLRGLALTDLILPPQRVAPQTLLRQWHALAEGLLAGRPR